MLCQNASTVWPDSVRPDASTMVPEMTNGSRIAGLVEQRLDGEDRGLGVERVEDRLDQEDVRAALDQTRGQFAVGDLELRPRDAAGSRIADVGAHRRGTVGRAERPGHEARPVGLRPFGGVRRVARQTGGRDVEVAHRRRIEAVVRLRDPGRGKRVRGQDVRSGLEIAGVDGADGRRLGEAQQVAVAAQVGRVVAEALTSEVGLGELVGLEHRAHRAVEDEDPLAKEAGQGGQARGPVEGRSGARIAGWPRSQSTSRAARAVPAAAPTPTGSAG